MILWYDNMSNNHQNYKKYKDICNSLDEVSKLQLMCEHIIKTWMEQ